MNLLPAAYPSAPDWRVDWPMLDARFDWIRNMRDCPQDPAFHAEGDVWTHVRMVCEAMAGLTEFRRLPPGDREVLFAAALLHDVAKPECTRIENGRITSRGHSRRGAQRCRRILWECGADFARREQACGLVRHHQAPFHLLDRTDPQRQVFTISQTARCDLLAILARADVLGRECSDRGGLLARLDLFEEYCGEQHCLTGPRAFPSAQSRFEYFRSEGRDPDYKVHEQPGFEVILMSGLPGAGKDTWIARHAPHLPQVSLDAIRAETGAGQGTVVQQAKERARDFLRACQPFVWNATNLGRDTRAQLINLFTAYSARVRIVYVEAAHEALFRQNESRATRVPPSALERMIARWDVPDCTEAPLVEWWIGGHPA